jgi:Protein of unknown function (DUF433)
VIDWRQPLTSDPKVCGGQLCAKGPRVLVTVILDNLAEGLGRDAEDWGRRVRLRDAPMGSPRVKGGLAWSRFARHTS